VFFTGASYDYTVRQYFPDAQIEPHLGSKLWSEIRANGLPLKTARTNHPKNLRLRKQFGILDELADWIKQPSE
jgi:hypothetical protein